MLNPIFEFLFINFRVSKETHKVKGIIKDAYGNVKFEIGGHWN